MTGSIPPAGPLAYEGGVAVPYITRTFPPVSTNNQFPVPSIWIDTDAKQPWILVGKAQGVADWLDFGSTGGLLTSITTPDMVVVVPTDQNINFLNGHGFNITGSGSNITFAANDMTLTAGTGLTGGGTFNLGDTVSVALSIPVSVADGGTGAITLTGVISGNGTSALTASPVTQHDVLIGGVANAVVSVAPSGTTGVPLISNGVSADPSFGVASVAGGGTGNPSQPAYSLLAGGTTTTGAFQAVGPNASSNALLMAAGTSALPNFTTTGTPYMSGLSFNTGTSVLDNYSKGSFTPNLTFGGASIGITYGVQAGKYWRIGDVVYITLQITLTNKGSSTGIASISNLPFASASDSSFHDFVVGGCTATNTSGSTSFYAFVGSGNTILTFANCGAGNNSSLSDTNFSNTTSIHATGFYWLS